MHRCMYGQGGHVYGPDTWGMLYMVGQVRHGDMGW